jgi:hypothetical protein
MGKDDEGNPVFKVTNTGIVSMTKGSITLGSGNNIFKVTDSGELTLGRDENNNPIFSVTNTGILTAKTGYIGPWSIANDGLSYSSNNAVLYYVGNGKNFTLGNSLGSHSLALKIGDAFGVSSTGKLLAAGVKINKLDLYGDFYASSVENPSDTSKGDGSTKVRMYSNSIWIGLGASSSKIWIDGTTSIGGTNPEGSSMPQDTRLYVNGNTRVGGTITFTNVIKAVDGSVTYTGVSDSYKVETGGWSSKTLVFKKGLLVEVGEGSGTSGSTATIEVSWNDIINKPSTFTPATHSHSWSSITSKPSSFTPAAHTHIWDDITNKPSTFTPSAHTHSDYVDSTTLNAKILELNTTIQGLTDRIGDLENEIETLKNNSSGGDSSTEES